ncbi:outer membrane protein, heavy metal efflux system [Methylomarinovum caldicuralii]|uniref:Outer membrane protein, heavy metal efflux system n=1 Tax=Methylomarinovum caldicuralii TaxID=438856 RepID=A0AAU9CST8_9GAMM|nr:TolC family protein [Methylomarinovum caldicuralii]BCX80977.1 outer membrane protein, heavy metal efflux system [Methylomarinovum caldicuralii]
MRKLCHWLFCACLLVQAAGGRAQEDLLVPHRDELHYDSELTLAQVVETALANFPRSRLAAAFREEARAWRRRAGGILAGPVMFGTTYSGDQVGEDSGAWEIDNDLTFMLWKWGQRSAAREVADHAAKHAASYRRALALQVAGLVRKALWDLRLKRSAYETARQLLAVDEKLVGAVRKRVEAGDLARADLLLAQTELLNRRAEAMTAEAEWMHARRRYLNLVRLDRVPQNFRETRAPVTAIPADHPLLAAAGARIAELKAKVRWTRFESDTGNQQVYLTVGGTHAKAARGGPTTHGLMANLTIPFGGGRYQAPNVAAEAITLAEAESQRGELQRRLERDLHEAEHALQVDRLQLEAAESRHRLAREHLQLARQAFAAGEMDLLDLLRIQKLAQEALRDARQWRLRRDRAIARYNQVVGVLPCDAC